MTQSLDVSEGTCKHQLYHQPECLLTDTVSSPLASVGHDPDERALCPAGESDSSAWYLHTPANA